MAGKPEHARESAAGIRATGVTSHASALREHLNKILESRMFKGSTRSQEFLKHIFLKALDGQFDDLKERQIGMELFGRPATYDTGEDAIVRVAASDVRKRLLQYYGEPGFDAGWRIDLPSGSYVPQFHGIHHSAGPAMTAGDAVVLESAPETVRRTPWRRFLVSGCVIAAVGVAVGLWLVVRENGGIPPAKRILPWSALFNREDRQTQIILSDTNISKLQTLLGYQIPLPDYANRRYLPSNLDSVGQDMRQIYRWLAGIEYTGPTASIDAEIVLRTSQLAQTYSTYLKVRPARALQLRDFKTNDNFILLGSPHSNPWIGLFTDQLDFTFAYDPDMKREICRNKRPQSGELALYVPTAGGGEAGQSFAVVALVGNPNHTGRVLILAGTTAEGTEAAARFLTDLRLLTATLRRFGIDPHGAPQHFQALLRVTEMAAAPDSFEVIALHRMPSGPGR